MNDRRISCLLLFLLGFVLITSKGFGLDRSSILFYAPLDGTTRAEISKGEASALPGYVLAFREGICGRAAVVSEKSGRVRLESEARPFWLDIGIKREFTSDNVGALRWSGKGNISGKEGTLAFWARPLDWKSADGTDHFLASIESPDTLSFIWAPYYGPIEFYQNRASNWDQYKKCGTYFRLTPERWRSIVASWRKGKMFFWIDGVRLGAEDVGVPGFGGPIKWFSLGEARKSSTAFDEVLVLSHSVSDAEAKALAFRHKRKQDEPLIRIPLVERPPRIDGKISPGEWADAALIQGWSDSVLGVANDDPTKVFLSYDARNLYLAFQYPIPEEYRKNRVFYVGSPLRMEASTRDDAKVLSDDHFEVWISPLAGKGTFRFALNGQGVLYDEKDGEVSFNSRALIRSSVDEDIWEAELAIPFSSLGAEPEEGDLWRFNLMHRAVHIEDLDSSWVMKGGTRRPFGSVEFAGKGTVVRTEALSNPSDGRVNVELSLRRAKPDSRYKLQAEISTTSISELDPTDEVMKEREVKVPGHLEEKEVVTGENGSAEGTLKFELQRPVAADLVISVLDPAGKTIHRQSLPFAFSYQVGMTARFLPTLERLILGLEAGSSGLIVRGVSARVEIIGEDGKVWLSRDIERMKGIKEEIEIETKDLPVGKYIVRPSFKCAGREMRAAAISFEKKPKPPWLDTKVGISDKVPWPWRPLERSEDSIECWGRKIKYGFSVLPSQITILGKPVLAEPMNLVIRSGDETFRTSDAKLTWKKTSERRIEFDVLGNAGPFEVKSENWMEFDGLLWVRLEVQGSAPIDGMALEIPLKPEYATHWYCGQYPPGGPTGYAPRERFVYGLRPFMRLGGYERGIQIGWESLKGWHIKDKSKAVEFIPGSKKYLLRYKFVDHAVKPGEPVKPAFSIHPLPVKPFPLKGWRAHYWGGYIKGVETPGRSITFWNGEWWWPQPHWNYPVLTAERIAEIKKSMLIQWKEKNHTHAFYMNHSNTDANTPEYRYYGEEWRVVPSPRVDFASFENDPKKAVATQVCYGSKSYRDFFLYHFAKMVKAFHEPEGIPIALYFDCSGPVSCANRYHGCGYEDEEGKWRPEMKVLIQREVMQRIYQIVRDLGPDNWITTHMSGLPYMALWSFSDVMESTGQNARLRASPFPRTGSIWNA